MNRQGNPVPGMVRCKAGPRAVDFSRALVLTGKVWGLRKRLGREVQVNARRLEDVKISDLKSSTTDIQKPKKRLGTQDTSTEGSVFKLRVWR